MSDGQQNSDGDETLPTIPPLKLRSRAMTESVETIDPDVGGPAWLTKSPEEDRGPTTSRHPNSGLPAPPPPPRSQEDSTQMGFGSGFPGPPAPPSQDATTAGDPSRSVDLSHSLDGDAAPAPVWSSQPALGQTLQGHPVRPPNPLDRASPVRTSRPPPPPKRSKPQPSQPVVLPLELIWVDTARAEEIARQPEWSKLVPEAETPATDWRERAEFGYGLDLYDEIHPPVAPEGRPEPERDALKVMQKATPQMLSALPTSVSEALRNDETLPLVAVSGTLTFTFDPRKHLETLLSAAKPFGKGRPRLAEGIQHAEDMLEAPIEALPDVARRVIDQLRAAWKDAKVNMPADYLDQTAERVLLTERAYERRELLASTWLRTSLAEGTDRDRVTVTAYLPEEIAKRLPLFSRFDARLIAEAHPKQDSQETPSVCLKVVAIARVIPDTSPRS